MKHLILFWILIATLSAANGTETITSARIDGPSNALILTIATNDCNTIMPMLKYNDQDSRQHYGNIYDLEFAHTRMMCPAVMTTYYKVVAVKLPPRSEREFVSIRHEDHEFFYQVMQPQDSINFKVGSVKDIQQQPFPQIESQSGAQSAR